MKRFFGILSILAQAAININTLASDLASYTLISGRYEVDSSSVIVISGANSKIILDGTFVCNYPTLPAISITGNQKVFVTSRTRIITKGGASILGGSANLPVTIQQGATANTAPISIQQLGSTLSVSPLYNQL